MRPPGPLEIGLILLIILIVFGVGKLPQVGAALGKGINAFRRGAKGEDDEEATDKTTKKKAKRKTKKTVKKTAPAKSEVGESSTQEEAKPAESEAGDTSAEV
jgi:sec-independent protein translocase protein TatA